MHPNIPSSTTYNSQDKEATQVPINRWMDKEDIVYIYTIEYYSVKKNEILPFATTDLEGITPSEISQTEKDKYCMLSPICEV